LSDLPDRIRRYVIASAKSVNLWMSAVVSSVAREQPGNATLKP